MRMVLQKSVDHDIRIVVGGGSIRSVESYIKTVAPLIEMEDHEAETLILLCKKLSGYHSYEKLRNLENELAARYDFVSSDTIGGSSDYGEARPIARTIIGDPNGSGGRAYLQGPDHACEIAGATTTAVIEQLLARQPQLLRRLGYSSLIASSHIDPDGMELQLWPLQNATLKQYVKYGYRGSWSDQVSWGYPTEGHYRVSSEVEASLSTLNTYTPHFVGSMHASNFAGYIVSSNPDKEMAMRIAGVLEESKLPINCDEPESINDPILAPGVFGIATSDSYKETRLRESQEPVSNTLDGGTNISQHMPDSTTLMIPETPAIIADAKDDLITDVTASEVAAYGAQQALNITDRIAEELKNISGGNSVVTPEFQRLHRASEWWCNTVPSIFKGQIAMNKIEKSNDQLLTRSQRAARLGTQVTNSLIHAGNVQRLAKMTNNGSVIEKMEHVIDDGLAIIGPTRRVQIGMQIAVQALTILIGMKYASTKE